MDWLSPIAAMTLLLALVSNLAVSPFRDTGITTLRKLKTVQGGLSRGGSSANRDDIRQRLSGLHQSIRKGLGVIINPGIPDQRPIWRQPCSLQNPADIQRLFPGFFLSETELMHMFPRTKSWVADTRDTPFITSRRLATRQQLDNQPRQFQPQAAFDVKNGASGFGFCQSCFTEIGYEIMDNVMDVSGRSRRVINFRNAYQFIPSGRCGNENSPCGFGSSRCKQIMRAHWTLVWSETAGIDLVAHEVPSHCECLNLGDVPSKSSDQAENKTGSNADLLKVAAVRIDSADETLAREPIESSDAASSQSSSTSPSDAVEIGLTTSSDSSFSSNFLLLSSIADVNGTSTFDLN